MAVGAYGPLTEIFRVMSLELSSRESYIKSGPTIAVLTSSRAVLVVTQPSLVMFWVPGAIEPFRPSSAHFGYPGI